MHRLQTTYQMQRHLYSRSQLGQKFKESSITPLSFCKTLIGINTTTKIVNSQKKFMCFWIIILILAEFILEDGKLVTDGIPSEKIPTNMNLLLQRMVLQLIQPKAI